MKKNILCINPWIYDVAAYDFWIKPLGLLYIAALLRKTGYNIRVIDCLNPLHPDLKHEKNIKLPKRKEEGYGSFPKQSIPKPLPLREIPRRYNRYGITPGIFKKELLNGDKPHAVLVTSMMTYWYPGVFEAIDIVRRTFPGVPIILGGNYATLCTEHATAWSKADYIVTGEGERSINKILNILLGDGQQDIPDFENLDSYPYPAFDLLPWNDQIPIITSRGCPFNCPYCASHILNKGFRVRDPIKVVDEIEFWNTKYGIKNFAFYDDALLVNAKERAIPMIREILRRKLDCSFHCPNGLHMRAITEELSNLMCASGFKTIRFGFETADVKKQIETGGKITNGELRDGIAHLRKAGYRTEDIGIYILCGLPGQSAIEVRESIDLVKSCGGRPMITEFSPIPGTQLWEKSVQYSHYDICEEPLYHNNTLLPCRGEKLSYDMYRDLKNLTRRY